MLPAWPTPPIVVLVPTGCPVGAICLTPDSAKDIAFFLDDVAHELTLLKDCDQITLAQPPANPVVPNPPGS